MSSGIICLGVLASSLGFSQYEKPGDYNKYIKLFKGPNVKGPVELRRNTPLVVETPKVCVVPLLEFKPQVQSRMPVVKPTAPTAPMSKFTVPPACPARTPTQP